MSYKYNYNKKNQKQTTSNGNQMNDYGVKRNQQQDTEGLAGRATKRSPSVRNQRAIRSAKYQLSRIISKTQDKWTDREKNNFIWATDLLAEVGSKAASGGPTPDHKMTGAPNRDWMTANSKPTWKVERAERPSTSHSAGGPTRDWTSGPTANKPATDWRMPAGQKNATFKKPIFKDEAHQAPKKERNIDAVNQAFGENVNNDLLYGISDMQNGDSKLTAENWRILTGKIAEEILSLITKNPKATPPTFTEVGWHAGGTKLIECHNQDSVDFLVKVIPKIKCLWPNARLVLNHWSKIPLRPRARAWLPPGPSDPGQILKLLISQNPGVPMDNWNIIKAEKPEESGRLVSFLINEESLRLVKGKEIKLNYIMSQVTLKVQERCLGNMYITVKEPEIGTSVMPPADTEGGKREDTTESDDSSNADFDVTIKKEPQD